VSVMEVLTFAMLIVMLAAYFDNKSKK
jgi:hypothetical protein